MTLVVKERDRQGPGTSGWQVVIDETGEQILSTQYAITRAKGEKSYVVYTPWPGFASGLRVDDEAESVLLAERMLARLLERLNPGVPR